MIRNFVFCLVVLGTFSLATSSNAQEVAGSRVEASASFSATCSSGTVTFSPPPQDQISPYGFWGKVYKAPASVSVWRTIEGNTHASTTYTGTITRTGSTNPTSPTLSWSCALVGKKLGPLADEGSSYYKAIFPPAGIKAGSNSTFLQTPYSSTDEESRTFQFNAMGKYTFTAEVSADANLVIGQEEGGLGGPGGG
jgi:hypothetical protein